jgi:hypothetical protein
MCILRTTTQKRPVSKETYYRGKRDLIMCILRTTTNKLPRYYIAIVFRSSRPSLSPSNSPSKTKKNPPSNKKNASPHALSPAPLAPLHLAPLPPFPLSPVLLSPPLPRHPPRVRRTHIIIGSYRRRYRLRQGPSVPAFTC